MEESEKNTIILDALFDKELERFEVYATNPSTNLRSLVLVLSIEEVLQQLKSMMLTQLNAMTNWPS